MKRFACLAFVLVAACGDDNTITIDAATIDARAIDAAVDAPIDAAPTVYSGTLTALEVALLNPGAGGTFFGQGLQVGVSFGDSVTGVPATMEEQQGSPLGCKLFNFNRAQAIQATVGNNEGDVQITFTGGTDPLTPPNVAACKFTAGLGYACPFTGTFGMGGTIAVVGGGAASLTVPAPGMFNDGNSLGSYVSISGAANAANNGVFPIIMRPAGNVIFFGNQAAVAEVALPAAATHVNIAGVGPIPGKADPGFLANDTAASFVFTPGAGSHFQMFTAAAAAPAGVGDDFTIPAVDLAKLNALPNANANFTFGCDPQMAGNTCGTATGALINIVTTDTATTGMSAFAMPLPTTKRVQIRCAAIGSSTITIPAAYMAALMTSGATRIQATYMRPTLMGTTPGVATVNALSGHAVVGFTNR